MPLHPFANADQPLARPLIEFAAAGRPTFKSRLPFLLTPSINIHNSCETDFHVVHRDSSPMIR